MQENPPSPSYNVARQTRGDLLLCSAVELYANWLIQGRHDESTETAYRGTLVHTQI